MNSGAEFVCFIIGIFTGALVLAAAAAGSFVWIPRLEQNGYRIVEHSERHGDFTTNWVEVVRTDGKELR